MTDVLIIGGGPAGVTAALYTARAGFATTILYKDLGALNKADNIANFYGHVAIGGAALVESGLQQAKDTGINIVNQEAVNIKLNDDETLTVSTTNAEYTAHAVVIATGANRTAPKIPGLVELEGKGVSYCAICDGFFYKGKDVAVIGSSAYALHEVEDLLPIAKSVTLLTNGAEPQVKFPESVAVKTAKVLEVTGKPTMVGDIVDSVTLADGENIPLAVLFVAVGVAGGTELARKLGAVIENNAVTVDEQLRTTVPNLWAAGDCTGGLKQIVKASHEGAMAGMDIVKSLKERTK